jgi:hypothetical protein
VNVSFVVQRREGRSVFRNLSAAGDKGFTIVELLVAGVITAVAFGGLVTLIIKGREIDTTDLHRRQARAVIMKRFEGPSCHYLNYSRLGTTILDSVVTLDARQGAPLTGVLGGSIVSTTVNSIPVKQITLHVNWIEHNGENQSVELTKWLCQVR